MWKLTFLGGVGTVTGSKYLLDNGSRRVLVDCGLFQGFKQLRLRNWSTLPVEPRTIDCVVLTHAHLDHSGYLPLLVKNGFSGPIYSTAATRDLCAILLPDSGFLQEKDADFANRHGFSKHHPALALYTQRDAEIALGQFHSLPFHETVSLAEGIECKLLTAGHILGAAMIEMTLGSRRVLFTGDLGRTNSAVMLDPARVTHADYLVLESTYGNRTHSRQDPEEALAAIINATDARGGTVIVPAFAVGRTQTLLFHIERLKRTHRIRDLPVFLDSPMAIDASDIFCKHGDIAQLSPDGCRRACSVARYINGVEESKALDSNSMPKVIISASGMATGGRVLHHLKHYGPDARHTILFTGFLAGGTRGEAMMSGAEAVKIHGNYVPIRAEVRNLEMLSAHADADEIMNWLTNFQTPPRQTFITHGEPAASDALRRRIEEALGWVCLVPEYRQEIALA
jgi:metallo-beta-lactamase family protein